MAGGICKHTHIAGMLLPLTCALQKQKGKMNERKKRKQVSITISNCARENENEFTHCTMYIWAHIIGRTYFFHFICFFLLELPTHFKESNCSIDPCRLKVYLTHFFLFSHVLIYSNNLRHFHIKHMCLNEIANYMLK